MGCATFRYSLFDILPVAREQVMEHMRAGVLIVDARPAGRI
jgi:hypothetical protein